jgi:hypothetical protein
VAIAAIRVSERLRRRRSSSTFMGRAIAALTRRAGWRRTRPIGPRSWWLGRVLRDGGWPRAWMS